MRFASRFSLVSRVSLASLAMFGLCVSALGCSSADSPKAQPDAAVVSVADAGSDAPPVDAVCEAQAAAITEGLAAERIRQKVQHAALALETARCGKRVFRSDDPSATDAVTDASLWRVGSVTKTFVSATVLNLAAAGKLTLDDTLDKYVPSFPNAAGITVRQLMNHTSGIFNYTTGAEFADALRADPKRKYTGAELVAFATPHPPTFEPGKGWEYSNTNYVLLGLVAEKAGGARIGALVRSNALGKAGLTHTFFDGEEAVVGTMTHGFQGKQDVTFLYDPSVAWAAGAIVSTPGDLLDWVHGLYGSERVISAASQKELRALVPKEGYGLGVEQIPAASTLGNGAGLGHSGSIFGYLTQAFWFEDTKVGLVALVDDSKGDPNALSLVALKALAQ